MPAKDSFESRPFRPSADRLPQPEPTIVYTTEVREPGTVAAWWVGGLVVIVAILAATFVVTRTPNADQQVAQAAAQQPLQGALDSPQPPANGPRAAAPEVDGLALQAATSAESANSAAVDASARASDPTSARTTGLVSSDSDNSR